MFDFRKIRSTVDDLGKAIATLRGEIEAKKQARENLQTAPIPKTELAADLCAWVDQEADRYREKMQRDVLQFFIDNPDATPCKRGYASLLCNAYGNKNVVHQPALLLLLGPQIKDAINGLVDSLDFPPEVAPPRAERLAQIEQLDQTISKLEESEAQLLTAAAAAGIVIAPPERADCGQGII